MYTFCVHINRHGVALAEKTFFSKSSLLCNIFLRASPSSFEAWVKFIVTNKHAAVTTGIIVQVVFIFLRNVPSCVKWF